MHRARSATIHQEEPIWEQFCALLPERKTNHPLGCHRSRIPEMVVFGKLVQILVFGCAYERIADKSCSESTLRRRRDEWIELGLMENLREISRCRIERACIWRAPTTRPPLAVDWRLVGWSVRSPRRASLLRSKPVCGGSWSARIRAKRSYPTRSWCTERRGRVIDFWVAFSDVVIIVRRLIREGWSRYRWEGRPSPTTMTN